MSSLASRVPSPAAFPLPPLPAPHIPAASYRLLQTLLPPAPNYDRLPVGYVPSAADFPGSQTPPRSAAFHHRLPVIHAPSAAGWLGSQTPPRSAPLSHMAIPYVGPVASTSASSSAATSYLSPVPNFQIPNIESFNPFAQRSEFYDWKTDNIGTYEVFRRNAKVHWDAMTLYMQKVASLRSAGQDALACSMLEKVKIHRDLAIVADEKASEGIFMERNKNTLEFDTIDLHGQHVTEALKYVQYYLKQHANTSVVQTLRVITGYGSTHGHGKIKDAVIKLLDEEDIVWIEENKGCLILLIHPNKQ